MIQHVLLAPGRWCRILTLPWIALWATLLARGRAWRLVLASAVTQVTHTAWRPALPLAAIMAVVGAGVVFAAQRTIGGTTLSGSIPAVLTVTVVRELGPLLVALVLVARTGNQVTFQLGLMRTGHELDALLAAGIDPAYFVVFPRLLGITLGSVGLTIVVDSVGLVGGYALAHGLELASYVIGWDDVWAALLAEDVALALVKAALSGLAVAATSCFFALTSERTPSGVRQAAALCTMHGFGACLGLQAGLSVYAFAS